MNTNTTLRARTSSFAAAVLLFAAPLGGCIIEGKIGDDPSESTDGSDDELESAGSTTSDHQGPGSGADPATDSATSVGPDPSVGSISFTGGGEDSGAGEDTGGSGVDPDTALELCGVVVIPPVGDEPYYEDGIMCADGCLVFVQSVEPTNLLEQGDCVCAAMECGPVVGGTTGVPGSASDTDTDTGEPDGCGPFPPGDSGFTCACEMCSIDVTNIDPAWLDAEADLEAICSCMCGGAGCGMPL